MVNWDPVDRSPVSGMQQMWTVEFHFSLAAMSPASANYVLEFSPNAVRELLNLDNTFHYSLVESEVRNFDANLATTLARFNSEWGEYACPSVFILAIAGQFS